MFCKQCGKELADQAVFCTGCGTKQIVIPAAVEYEKNAGTAPAPFTDKAQRRKGKGLLFGAAGMVIGAIILCVVLYAAGVFSSGGRIEGPGFGAPEDAAKAYLAGLRDQDIDMMISAFAMESYADHYDFEAFIKRLNAYNPSIEMRLPNTSDYARQLNIEGRRSRIINQILNQYMQFQAPDIFNDGEISSFEDIGVSDFAEDFEKDTKNYAFEDLSVIATLDMQDLPDNPTWDDIEDIIPKDALDNLPTDLMEGQLEALTQAYKSETNQDNMAEIAEIYGADSEDVTNVVVFFEADHKTWAFCPQVIRYNGKWYIDCLQGTLGSLAGLPIYTGGIMPVD